MEVLVCLCEANGHPVSKEQLIRQVWSDTFVTDDVLKGSIWQLRKAFHDNSRHPQIIETIPKGGYRLIARADAVSDSAPASSMAPIQTAPPRALAKRSIWIAISMLALAGTWMSLRIMRRADRQPSLELVPITTLPGLERHPSFSPDGTQIVFDYLEGGDHSSYVFQQSSEINLRRYAVQVHVQVLGDERTRRLTALPGHSWCPQWSPDGRLIAYLWFKLTADGASEKSIYVMTPSGGDKRKVIDVRTLSCLISWSAESDAIAYSDQPSPDEPFGVFIVDLKNSRSHRVTTPPPGADDLEAVFSHSGKQIAFVRRTDVQTDDLYTVASIGGEAVRRTFRNAWVSHPIWTTDDKRIIFTGGAGVDGSFGDLYSVTLESGKPERLPFSSHDVFGAAISKQGDKLAYAKAYYDANIWSVNLSKPAAAPRKFIASTAEDSSPAFSPDGKRIAFYSERGGVAALWVGNADGSDPTHLVDVDQGGSPRWSPDGKQIAYDSRSGGSSHIYVISADGGSPVQIAQGSVPDWTNDGKSIYFTSVRSGVSEVWKISMATKKVAQITRHSGMHAQDSPDGTTIYYEKPENPTATWSLPKKGVWSMPSGGGSETLLVPEATLFWQVRPEGIYYVDNEAQPHPKVQLFRFGTGKITTVAYLDKSPYLSPGLCISPDGRTLLYPQIDASGSDLMLVKNGRW
jgi:Tol biopolymer transport system component/DNA-binding winged helix-turn-helix (wHTH) protein